MWLLLSALASACAPGPGADGAPEFDNSTLPNFAGNPNGAANPNVPGNPSTAGNPNNPAGPNPNGGSGYVPPGNTNGGEPNQNGGTPVTNGNNAGNDNGGNDDASSGTGGSSGQLGGAGNTGNVPGTAGTNSMPPPGDPGTQEPPPPPPEPPGDAFFFDDFEAGTVGQQPPRWSRWINYSTNAGNTATGSQFALVDDQESFSGGKSVHFRVREGNMPAMLTIALPAQSNRIHLRARVMTSIQVGGVQPDQVSNHETLLGLRAVPNDGNFEIRFGGAKGALGFNMVGPDRNDAVAPPAALWGSQPGMAAGQWHCVEVEFNNTNPSSPVARASLNGTVVRTAGDWHVGVTQQWLSGMFVEAIIGWQSFSPAPSNDVWMDDVVLSNGPIGCD